MARSSGNFKIFVFIPLTKERFTITDIHLNTTVSELKKKLELLAGIPRILQRLFYLDKDDLLDSSDLRSNDVVMSAILSLHIWSKWQKIVLSSFLGNPGEILNSRTNGIKRNKDDLQYILDISLFISANKGKKLLMETLIHEGANVNWATTLGRTALHAAAAQGQTKCIDLLLEHKANADIVDLVGKTPAMVANEYGHRKSEKQLFLFQWQKRASQLTIEKDTSTLFMHQQFDSGYSTWLKGRTQQVYLCSTLPAGEFIGTQIDASRQYPLRSGLCKGQQCVHDANLALKERNDGLLLPRLPESPLSAGAERQGKITYKHWLSQKKAKGKAKTTPDLKDEKRREKDTKLFEKDHRVHFKYAKRSPILSDKLRKKGDIYDDHNDFMPIFEQDFLRTMDSRVLNCLT